jgi:hypothetical protein
LKLFPVRDLGGGVSVPRGNRDHDGDVVLAAAPVRLVDESTAGGTRVA